MSDQLATTGETSTASWTTRHAVDIAFGAVVLFSVLYWLRLTRHSWFFADDWTMAYQLRQPKGIIEPYNSHLSVNILLLYRVLLGVFGFSDYTPFRLAGILSFAAVGSATFITARERVGAPVAALMGLLLLWVRGMSLEPGGLNHSLALAGAIVCAYGLTGVGRRRDAITAAGLVFALGSTGAGVAVIAAAIVHSICSRATRTRWVAVLVPSALWLAWYEFVAPRDPYALPMSRRLVARAFEELARSFRFIALGNGAVGWLLLALFVVYAGWRLRQGTAAAANVAAWTTALVVWWVGLMRSRSFAMNPPAFRYEFLSIGFLFLAVLPGTPVDRSSPIRLQNARQALLAASAIPVVVLLLALAVRPDLRAFANQQRGYGRISRCQVAYVRAKGSTVPDSTSFRLGLGYLDAGQVRATLRAFGEPDVAASGPCPGVPR